MGRYGVTAKLVWDGGKELFVPEEMGKPREDQLQGTIGERLSEVGGRICYDSCGTGRSSREFHPHILGVGHYSIYEHHHITIRWNGRENPLKAIDVLWACRNRPDLWIEPEGANGIRLTFDPRVVLDWDRWDMAAGIVSPEETAFVGKILRYYAEQEWPQITPCPAVWDSALLAKVSSQVELVEPYHPEEKWVSMYMSGSRGFSHELVRHGDRTAISQRSTRFVDESESPWIDHPLVQEFMKEASNYDRESMRVTINEVEDPARSTYLYMVEKLQPWLISKGVDKLTARKQARGAARGYLGNALQTELIFSASVAQWKRMLRMRACAAADAEIRAVFVQALEQLRASRYKEDFEPFKLALSPDGMGHCVVEEQ